MLCNADAICAILSTCLQYADHTDRATLPIGVKGRRKEKKRKEKKKKKKKMAVPRAAAAYGRQLKMHTVSALLKPRGSIFQNEFLNPDYRIKVISEGMGLQSRLGLQQSRYGNMFLLF